MRPWITNSDYPDDYPDTIAYESVQDCDIYYTTDSYIFFLLTDFYHHRKLPEAPRSPHRQEGDGFGDDDDDGDNLPADWFAFGEL